MEGVIIGRALYEGRLDLGVLTGRGGHGGPGAVAAAHADDEHVLTAELHAAVRIYLRLALRLCETEWRAAHA